jgi:hypothetical protein
MSRVIDKEVRIKLSLRKNKPVNIEIKYKNTKVGKTCEISSSHGGEYDVQSCLLGYTAV